MEHDEFPRALFEHLDRRADRPFGDLQARSGRTLQAFSFAGQQAAENLLVKAGRALDAHDVDRARSLVDRAVRLPFDEHEGAAPATLAVHLDLFCVITDAAEQADQDDVRWLDAALEVLNTAEQPAVFDLRDVLAAIDHDYTLSPSNTAASAPRSHRSQNGPSCATSSSAPPNWPST